MPHPGDGSAADSGICGKAVPPTVPDPAPEIAVIRYTRCINCRKFPGSVPSKAPAALGRSASPRPPKKTVAAPRFHHPTGWYLQADQKNLLSFLPQINTGRSPLPIPQLPISIATEKPLSACYSPFGNLYAAVFLSTTERQKKTCPKAGLLNVTIIPRSVLLQPR